MQIMRTDHQWVKPTNNNNENFNSKYHITTIINHGKLKFINSQNYN